MHLITKLLLYSGKCFTQDYPSESIYFDRFSFTKQITYTDNVYTMEALN